MTKNKPVLYLCVSLIIINIVNYFIYKHEVATTPQLLHAYKNYQYSNLPDWWGIITLIILLTLVTKYISIFGVIFNKNWAKYLFLVSFFVPVILHPLLGHFIVGPYSGLFNTLETLVSGAIIGIIYFTDARHAYSNNS